MGSKQYSADEVFAMMDGLSSDTQDQPETMVEETTTDEFSVPELDGDTSEGYQEAILPEDTGDVKSGIREKVIRPIVEGIQNPKEATKGLLKGVGKTIFNMGRLGESAFEKTIGQVPRIWGGDAVGRSEDDIEKEMQILKALESSSPAQQLGGAVEGVAEAVVPGTIASRAVSNVANVKKLGTVAKGLLEIGTQGLVAGGQEAIAQGEMNEESAKAALISAGTQGVFEGLGAAWKAFKASPLKDEIAANILGPTKSSAGQFDDAVDGISTVAESFPGGQAKIAKELTKTQGRDAYTKLAKRATQMQDGIWSDLKKKLSGITATARTTEAGEAISLAKDALKTQPGNTARKALLELENLGAKNVAEGLTPLEMTRVKILFSDAENMYNSLGNEVKGISADALRDVRSSLKDRIEAEAAKNGVTDVAELNAKYGQLAAAKNMLENRANDYIAFTGRQVREKVLQKAARMLMELPVIKQTLTQPAQTIAAVIGKGIRSDKVNVLEIEKQVPEMLNELRKLGLKQADFNVAEAAIKSAIRSAAVEENKRIEEMKMGVAPNA
jgi:hypothetical protein